MKLLIVPILFILLMGSTFTQDFDPILRGPGMRDIRPIKFGTKILVTNHEELQKLNLYGTDNLPKECLA